MSVRLRRLEYPGDHAAGSQARFLYKLGVRAEAEGNMERAAGWFRKAAEAGIPEAALRLGGVLGHLAEQPVGKAKASPEQLLAEASRWASGAGAGPDKMMLITDLLNRQQRLAARRALETVS